MNKYLEMSQKIESEVIEIRRYLHAHPEIGFDLPITTNFVLEKLAEFGIEGKIIADSSITACIGKKHGKTILLRADMDALPVKENLDLEFKSKFDGRMHACGHDMHTAMLLGAAKILKENEDMLEGQVKFMFQPNEEGFGGALKMIDANILKSPKVDFAMALHVFPGQNNFPVGLASVQGGPLLAGSQNFRIDISGKGGHGGMPQISVDPIAAANHIYSQIQTVKAREISATDPLVLSICQFSFGDTHNIIPNEGVMQGTMRFF
ncbi:MAG: M20 family metallopeptidase [Bacilli bacterium]